MAETTSRHVIGIFTSTKPDVAMDAIADADHPDFTFKIFEGVRYEECDIALYFGSEKSGDTAKQNLRRDIDRRHRGPALRCEVGYLGRKNVARRSFLGSMLGRRSEKIAKFQHSYYRFGINGIFPDTGDFINRGSPPDRWNRIARELDLELAPYRHDGRHVLLVGQTPGDASLDGIDLTEWLHRTAIGIRNRTRRPIVFRAHPGMLSREYRDIVALLSQVENLRAAPHSANFVRSDLEQAKVACCYSSSFSLDALMAGIPVIALSKRNIAYDYCSQTLDAIEEPALPDRLRLFSDVAYAQWSFEEMRNGAVLEHYGPTLAELSRASRTAQAAGMESAT